MEKRLTISECYQAKAAGKKFGVITCYDFTTARILAEGPIEMLLVGDSAAEMMLGFESTLPATMDFMVAITAAVRRGAPNKFVIADMPFLSYQLSREETLKNAARFIIEGGADIVKIEATAADLPVIESLANAGIAVMAHIGIRPQSVALMGKLKAEGTIAESAFELIMLARKMVEAGAKMLLLEGTAKEVAKIISEHTDVPVIGCGSGLHCDGQVLVINDVVGTSKGSRPKFAKTFGEVGAAYCQAFARYYKDVSEGKFPDDEHSYHLKSGEAGRIEEMLKNLKTEL